jgi:3',5'-cyclic AMP phosphodiesterase CpdA
MLDRLEALFATAGDRMRIVAMHHPLEHLPGEEQWLMQGAELALRRLPGMGVRMVLSGHIHVSHAGPFTAAPGLLFVQAGTGLSWRRRAEANAFNLLDIRDEAIEVQTILADETGAFAAVGRAHSFPHVVA